MIPDGPAHDIETLQLAARRSVSKSIVVPEPRNASYDSRRVCWEHERKDAQRTEIALTNAQPVPHVGQAKGEPRSRGAMGSARGIRDK